MFEILSAIYKAFLVVAYVYATGWGVGIMFFGANPPNEKTIAILALLAWANTLFTTSSPSSSN